MSIDKLRKIFRAVIKIIIAVGFIGGILCGASFMGPSANALRYPTLYENEMHVWTLASTVATGITWLCSAVVALMLYSQIALVELVYKILRIKETEKNEEN